MTPAVRTIDTFLVTFLCWNRSKWLWRSVLISVWILWFLIWSWRRFPYI